MIEPNVEVLPSKEILLIRWEHTAQSRASSQALESLRGNCGKEASSHRCDGETERKHDRKGEDLEIGGEEQP